jgi:archaellum biogenesis protein FlaJ (TadC family)
MKAPTVYTATLIAAVLLTLAVLINVVFYNGDTQPLQILSAMAVLLAAKTYYDNSPKGK